ncbi:dihydrofolate reductase family protein [Williamsia deligens]|uniref:Dihydrofolate reductase family protein n=1 Tax=Williamsia deligens TaxID=321325 RepID=A0ABW3GAW8_9NOCA|nr:dihydrofolate reductase family protein [Williamsia deligens]MCP2195220.1 Dihydrofolate reductase [Williamsia deligens]
MGDRPRELVYYVAVSLDGRIAGEDGDFSMFPVEGDHMATITTRFADALPAPAVAALQITPDLSTFDTVVMGRATHAVGVPHGLLSPYPHLRQFVASRSTPEVGDDVEVTADPVTTVRALKGEAGGSGIWLCGGGRLASALRDEIDRMILKVNPVVIGASGRPLFDGPGPERWAVDSEESFASGVRIVDYRRVR